MNASIFSLAVKGAAKSWTMWAAGLLAVLTQLTPILTPDFLANTMGLEPHTVQKLGGVLVIIMAILRVVTKQSLANKGAGIDPQPPPAPEPPAAPGPNKAMSP
jgi:small neutral amino acid transporter SnatA (MarC family)